MTAPGSVYAEGRKVSVRALVWGISTEAVENAVFLAGAGPAREGWRFESVERIESDACPLNVQDPNTIAAEAGEGWAYAVYRAEHGDG